MALSTLAEWTGSAIINNLVDTAYSYLGQRMLPENIEDQLNRLTIALPKITTVMSVAEALKFKSPGMNAWLQQFKLAFLAAEDVLDELEYWELADKVKNQAQVSESSSSILGSLKRKFPSSNISNDTLGRLRKAVQMLDMASTEVGSFFQFATAMHGHGHAQPHYETSDISSRETTSFLTESKVFGRENEKAKIIEWLKKPTSHALISAFCIVGPGGLGKTTLAQLIYEEMYRGNYFDKIIWVYVSTSFRVEEITRKISQELEVNTNASQSLNDLQHKIKEKVLSKKILFILDDVWNDDKMWEWEKLIAPLKFVQEGSKILLTTRMKSVSDMLAHVLNIDNTCLHLRGLEKPELLLLFNKYAFHGCNPDSHIDLQNIGNDIVQKLKGSPLAAKVIGSLLNLNMDFHYWKRILFCNSLINLEQAKNVADVLALSYYHLSADLQECFRFCSIFPRGCKFDKNILIKMWMASGFIRKQLCGEARPEDVGEEYFNHLLRKSFFEPHSQRTNFYIMHDLMHDLAENVSNGECCRVDPFEKSVEIPNTAQHVSVHELEVERVFHLRNLRTLLITTWGRDNLLSTTNNFVMAKGALKETLRVLDIHVDSTSDGELPEEIGGLIHLRYLTISEKYSKCCVCPSSIYRLHHLQVFEWYGKFFETIGMTNLVSLRYLNLPNEMMQNIKGLHKLTSLQELTFIVRQERGHHIDELKTLNNLRKLSIEKIGNVGDPIEAKNAQLSEKTNLVALTLDWSEGRNPNNPEDIIDNLQPYRGLTKLTIEYYKGCTSPIWMRNFPLDLSSLILRNCPLWKDLLLGQMPYLRELTLHRMDEVKKM